MAPANSPELLAEEYFSDNFGNFVPSRHLISKLVNRHPRKIGPIVERLYDLRLAVRGLPGQLLAAAAKQEKKSVLVAGVQVETRPDWMPRVLGELMRSRHEVVPAIKNVEGKLRMENLNDLLGLQDLSRFDWVIIVDDDIGLPFGFMDNFIFLLENFGFCIAQPAHNLRSYASFEVNRRKWGAVARQTGFVEVGPLVAFHKSTFSALLPFPNVGMGHGLDIHWSYLAKEKGWKLGVVDAVPIRHLRPVGGSYNRTDVRRKAVEFVTKNGGAPKREALQTLATFTSL